MTTPRLKRGARAVADVGGGAILASVEIAAAPERVYQALTSPTEIVKWWGADDQYWTTGWTGDLRPGGRWRAEGKGADGHAFSVEGEYLELDPPRKIVCTWKAAWDDNQVTTITYRIEPIDGGVRVVVRHDGFGPRAESCRGHASGWERVLGWLGGYAGKAPEERFYMLRLLPPRPSFMMDMNADEQAMMRAHAAYWTGHMHAGRAIVFGPVLDPQGGWGLGVLRVRDEAELQALQADDPAITAGRGLRYEVLPLARALCPG
jgi:uncharacterized protein YndB with AHSA1/START domain/uncharacterized protein YciI